MGAWFSWDNIWVANYSIIAYAYGHIREVNKMFKLIFGYSFWTCFGSVNVISFSQCFGTDFLFIVVIMVICRSEQVG